MLCRRKIKLHADTPRLQQTLISRDTLADYAQAKQLLSDARSQAEELLIQAEHQREKLLERAGLEFWQRANAQLKCWESAQKAIYENLECYATVITNQAIGHLLNDTVQPQRLAALLKQLLASQMPEIGATLLCHPAEIEDLKQCFIHHRATLWKLQPDETIPAQTLVLKTDEGDFHISWACILDPFMKQDNSPSTQFVWN